MTFEEFVRIKLEAIEQKVDKINGSVDEHAKDIARMQENISMWKWFSSIIAGIVASIISLATFFSGAKR